MKQRTPPSAARIIYDLGANNGDDVAYYLRKADKVVAVEANPDLAAHLRARFAAEIAAGRVVVEHCALTDDPAAREVKFFVNRGNDGLSRLAVPDGSLPGEFVPVVVPARRIGEIVGRHGAPYYLKVDLEGHDHVVLKDLFLAGIYPPYVSAEAHSIEVFCVLVALGGYRAFKLVRSQFFAELYARCTVETRDGPREVAFDGLHMTGPFGTEVAGEWMDPVLFQRYLAHVGLGWNDIHASRVDDPAEHRVGALAEIGASLAYQLGMRINSRRLMRWSRRLWGAA